MDENIFTDKELYLKFHNIVQNPSSEIINEALSFLSALRETEKLDDVMPKLRLQISEITSYFAQSAAMEQCIKFLLLLQFEAQKLSNTSNPDVVDFELSDWAAELLERLGICTSSRADWRNFIKKALVERFQQSHGKTLTQIHLTIGLEPPACLPALDGDDTTGISDSPTFPKDTLTSPVASKRTNCDKELPSPSCLLSPRSRRVAARQSLPRALFTDLIVLSSSNSAHTKRRTSLSATSAFSSGASAGGGRLATPRSPLRSDSKRATPAPQLVLIPAGNRGRSSTKARRKARTPVKRLLSSNSPAGAGPFGPKGPSPGRRSSRGGKLGSTPSPAPRATSRRSASRPSPSAVSVVEAGPGTAVTTPSAAKSRRSTPRRRGVEGRRRTGTPRRRASNHQHHRSVHETPNPKQSYPRWERAVMAAAEKTKDKLVIVAESPIKPDSVLGSPLRRLRRASSLLDASRLSSSFLCGGLLGGGGGGDSSLSGEASTCTSIGMTRAERWRRRQYEEELSLSQFTQPLPASSSSPCCPLSPCEGSSTQPLDGGGGSSCGPGRGLRRQSSNLFANLLLSPSDKRRQLKPALVSTVSSPPVLALSARNLRFAEPSVDEPPTTPKSPSKNSASFYLSTPPKNVFSSMLDADTPTQRKSLATSPFVAAFNAPAPSTPQMTNNFGSNSTSSGLLTFGRSLKRPTPSRFSSSKSEVPISPQVFDEAAMFLGEAEFLRKTTPARVAVAEIVASPTTKIMSASSARKRPQLSPPVPSDNYCPSPQKYLKQARSCSVFKIQRDLENVSPFDRSPGGRLNTQSAQAPYSPTTPLRSPLSPLSSNSSFRRCRSDFMPPTPGNDSASNRCAVTLLSPLKGLNGPIKTPKKVLFGRPLASAPILNLSKARSPRSKPVVESSEAELQIAAGFEPEECDFQTLSSPPLPSQNRSRRQSLRSQAVQQQRRPRRSLFQ